MPIGRVKTGAHFFCASFAPMSYRHWRTSIALFLLIFIGFSPCGCARFAPVNFARFFAPVCASFIWPLAHNFISRKNFS
jgi:hypothetical protein